ncbi:hypothetical protein B4U80_13267 [Leptotrombidium deliense]|uniref:C2H2-type domain-containing protein n=1 Tax=Leptotrombidium deliense TaxID=299467 RepID=A0A443S9B4_9ACAR|nr:hypothetical protein B4U80_13267 [Leptotrombidium deliense]
MEFFRTVAQRVAENLLLHVDGRLEKKSRTSSPDIDSSDVTSVSSIDLSIYNFPASFQRNIGEISVKEECGSTLNANFDRSQQYRFKTDSIYMCSVCGDSFHSVHEFDEHELNNHPNVVCSYVEADCIRDVPPHLLSWSYNSPVGVLRRCVAPPSLANTSDDKATFKCTKCNQCFPFVGQLHQHIVDCASFTSQVSVEEEKSSTDNTEECCYNTRSSKKRNSKQVKFKAATLTSEKCDVAVQVSVNSSLTFVSNCASLCDTSSDNTIGNSDSTPKRYSCTKCAKKFLFLITLKKHQMSCSKVLFRGRKPKAFKSIINRFINNKKASLCRNSFKLTHRKRMKRNNKELRNLLQLTNKSKKTSNVKPLTSTDNRCPRCSRVFTYLANFKKHVKKNCVTRNINDSNNQKNSNDINNDNEKLGDSLPSDDDFTETEQSIECDNVEHKSMNGLAKDTSKLDLWRIKQEHPLYAFKGSPAQHHSCPYCQRGFTYLANYRKHINGICPIRQQKEKEKSESLDIGEAEVGNENVSSILRDQTKSNEMNSNLESVKNIAKTGEIKTVLETQTSEVKENNSEDIDGQKFRTFSCNICHRIYLSHVKMLRHMLSHKLAEGSANTHSSSITDSSQEKCIAKLALQRHSNDVRKIRAIKLKSPLQSEVPCANLLEDLARGGIKENQHLLLNNEEENENENMSQLDMNVLSTEKYNESSDCIEANKNYEVVITEQMDDNESSPIETVVSNICLGSQLTRIVDSECNVEGTVDVLKLNENNNDEVWITFTADENDNNDQSAYLQMSHSVTY